MRVFPTLVMGCALILGGWPPSALADPFKLNSGKIVDILAVETVKTAQGPALKLRYSSKTPLSDTATLRKEADGLWEHFFVNAERGGHSRAEITAVGPNKAGAGTPVDFIFVKRAGDWRTLEMGLGPKGKLTENFLRELDDRGKWISDHKNYNAILLYLAKDWTVTYIYPRHLGIEPVTLDRESLFELYRRFKDKLTSFNITGQSEILSIQISNNGLAVQTETRAKRHATIQGRPVTLVGRLIENIELRQGAVVATQAHLVVEDIAVGVEH